MAPRSKAERQVAATVTNDAEMSDAGSSDWEIDNNNNDKGGKRRAALVLDKDAEEEDLERLVLGDRAGFRAQLFGGSGDIVGDAGRSLDELALAVMDDRGEDREDNPFEDAEDAHMFLYDESMQPHTSFASTTTKQIKASGTENGPDPNAPAWEDSDDERLVVSLAGRTQLRKLRRTEGEDMVNGTVYAARLRQQYLRLNPQPGWAVEADNARLERLQLRSGGKKKEKREKKEKKSKKKARRRSSAAAAAGDNDLSDEVRNSDSDSNLDAASDTSSDSDSSDDEASYELLGSALPLDALLRSTSAMASASQMLFAKGGKGGVDRARRLRPEVIDIQKTRDIPTPHAGPVGSLSFHPAYNVLLSSSTSCMLHLHQIAPGAHPTPNPLLTSVRVRRTPVRRSDFLLDPSSASTDAHQIVFAGRRRFFHTWDLATGKVQTIHRVQGHALEHRSMERFRLSPAGTHMALVATDRKRGGIVNVLDVQTMQWVAQARHESVGGVADLQWWRDGSGMTILGRDGSVGEWSLEARRFVGVWRDDGSTGGTVLALGGGQVAGQTGGPAMLGGDRWVAIGSKTGITNLYDRAQLVETNGAATTVVATPTPLRVLEQLVTPITSISFTPDGQLMAFASKHKQDALRLVHLPSATVYRNWPTSKTPLGRITAVAFSRDNDFLAVGNDAGKTRLWEIRA
ncbi:U3 small nucleolar RNA-associated protein 18 [Sporothrix brasiliensis 5110]|uniref:U3 small nucleolar RNA-associated protein 18 n=1 Tax=Sporothrix brasiliensis 5110 TaxID=1398154 RepID=A0A0C2IQA8_9PEZI|nr:U3 small nucleolar RNA-associated protein 18 [Sporothrix brasiliensis 5110]KIH87242.1 U3 small nucleolar RNA-associated protein 18 [Sporothrix brasiliensis 5110]